MRRAVEFGVAAGAAVALHLAGFAALGNAVPPGAQSAGDGGAALVSLVAADARIAAMIDDWERPPEVAVAPTTAPTAPQADILPEQPVAERTRPVVKQPTLPELPRAEAAPELAALAPPPRPEPPPAAQRRPDPPMPAEVPPVAPPVAKKPAPAQAAQAATGQGAKGAAGQAGDAQAATASGAEVESLRAAWGAEIRARIERHKSYPRDGDGAEGTVKLRIVVGGDGRLRGVAVARSSGSQALDRAAVRAVERAGRFPRAPKGVQGEVSFTLPVSFRP